MTAGHQQLKHQSRICWRFIETFTATRTTVFSLCRPSQGTDRLGNRPFCLIFTGLIFPSILFTTSSSVSPWLGQVCCSLDQESSEWPGPERGGEWWRHCVCSVLVSPRDLCWAELLNTFTDNLDKRTEWSLSKLADYTELGESVGLLKSREALQRDMDRLVWQAETNSMIFNKTKWWGLHLDLNNPLQWYSLGVDCWKAAQRKRAWLTAAEFSLTTCKETVVR